MLLSFFDGERPFRTMRPGRLIVLVFLFIILLGAGLLCLPAASRSGEATPFLTSLFTATSATCVTGLIRVDTGTHWAMFGQVVILLLIQVGGLGFMTIACLFFFALRRKIGLRERMVLAQALGSDSYSGIVSLVRNILRGTAAVEGAGALILFFVSCRSSALEKLCGTAYFIRSPRSATQALMCLRIQMLAGVFAAMQQIQS